LPEGSTNRCGLSLSPGSEAARPEKRSEGGRQQVKENEWRQQRKLLAQIFAKGVLAGHCSGSNLENDKNHDRSQHGHNSPQLHPVAIKHPLPMPSTPHTSTGRIRRSEEDIASVSTKICAPQFNIIDESQDYIVVDKPAFLLTHPTKPDQRTTLWKQLRELLAFEIANGGQVSIVNRLDRETSGLVLVAKTASAARRFGLLMQQQRFHKEYLAIVCGWPEWKAKTVDAPLDRQGKHQASAIWLKQMVHPLGASAVTEFRVEQRFRRLVLREVAGSTLTGDRFALIRAIPKTGRTHQIRVHLASLGHAIVGDKIYGQNENLYLQFIEAGWTPKLARELLLPRHALHAAKMSLEDDKDWIADLPRDLSQFMGTLAPSS
jgi:23S rRNA pseudouridine1911/1915/1917 synthase